MHSAELAWKNTNWKLCFVKLTTTQAELENR